MSEYIIDYELIPLKWRDGYGLSDTELTEEIVRCGDCANFDAKRDGCWWFAHAERQPDYSWADEPSDVEPDGFCAWAQRKEVDA